MAKKKPFNLGLTIISCILAVVVGLAAGLVGPLYVMESRFTANITTDELVITEGHEGHVEHADIDVENSDLTVHFIELGNKYTGDCTLIKCGNTELLIDCGSKSSSIPTVKSYLDEYVTDGILEYIIVTHAHQDHYAGFATGANESSIFDLYNCGTGTTIITFSRTKQNTTKGLYANFTREIGEAESRGATIVTADDCYNRDTHTSTTYNLSEQTSFEILYNPYYYEGINIDTENNCSVCCMVTSGEHNFLFTGDLEAAGEAAMASQYKIDKGLGDNGYISVDLYKAGHHGSKTSSSAAFLEVFRPQICCVCCCAGSPEYTKTAENQFPTQDFINRISVYTAEVYVTTMCVDYDKGLFTSFNGNIVVGLVNGSVVVKCSNNDVVLKDSDWFKDCLEQGKRTCPSAWATASP